MAEIVAKRFVEHLERAGFVMKRPPEIGGAVLGFGFDDLPAVECTNAEQAE